jgi:hypothetical protein
MLTTNIKVPAGGSIVVSLPFESVSVRRLLMNVAATDVVLYYDNIPLINTSLYTALYELKFESYYGFPDASHFKLVNNTNNTTYVKVLIDTVPSTQINENYFTEVTI